MGAAWYTFYEVSVCSPGQTEHIPHSNIPGFVDPVHILGVKIPEAASIEACAIDVQKFHESLWGYIVKLLQEGVDLANELAALCHNSFEYNVWLIMSDVQPFNIS